MNNYRMDLDEMLKELGQFGRYQFVCYVLLLFPVTMSGYCTMEYVFLTMDIPHRCRIPECDGTSENVEFSPGWLNRAVPFSEAGDPEQCLKYRTRINGTGGGECPADLFDRNSTTECSDWIFQEPTRTLVQEFKLLCPDDDWDTMSIGSAGFLTAMIGFPLAGILSDRWGRKTVMVTGATLIALIEIYRSFLINYNSFMNSQLVLGLLSGTLYAPSFIIGLEMLSSQKRLLGSMLINIYFCVGEVLLGLVMWWVQDWRLLLRIFYIPMLALASYFWLLPESIRWLFAKRRFNEVKKILTSIARANRTTNKLPSVLAHLEAHSSHEKLISTKDENSDPGQTLYLKEILSSRILMLRLVACSLCWVAMLFTYYGLSVDSIGIGGNCYIRFILVSLVEIPAYVVSLWVPDVPSLGRRWTTAGSFFLTAAAASAFLLIHEDMQLWHDVLILVSKFCATLNLTVIYLYTSEVFPTELRSSLLLLCSMMGRIGQFFVPQIPLMQDFVDPMVIFGAVSLVGGALSLTFPETLNTKLPDTIEEAENIGKTELHTTTR